MREEMAKLKLGAIADDKSVKLTVELPAIDCGVRWRRYCDIESPATFDCQL
jgi:hypothetical protein